MMWDGDWLESIAGFCIIFFTRFNIYKVREWSLGGRGVITDGYSQYIFLLGRPCYISALCLLQNPALTAWLGHPACVQGLTCAPCKIQTPPFLACLVHPSWLQIYLYGVAPCLTQTPPFFAILVHPSWLQVFADARFAPCLIHTPSLMDWFVHPSWWQIFTLAPCPLQTPPVVYKIYVFTAKEKRQYDMCYLCFNFWTICCSCFIN